MNKLLALGVATLAISVSPTVLAADFGSVMQEPVAMTDPGFDWDGFYGGVIGIGTLTDFGNFVGVNGAVGMIYVLDNNFALNVEGQFGVYTGVPFGGGVYTDTNVTARVGYVMDNVMIYGMGGVGLDSPFDLPEGYLLAGGGIWFAATDDVSLRLEGQGQFFSGATTFQATAGAFWHFD